MTTSWSLHLTRHETGQERESTIAQTITEDPAVMAATLRAAADRLDPPKPVRPVYRRGDHMRAATGNAYDAQCRGNDCAEGHTYLPGCLLEMPSMRALAERNRLATPAEIDAMVCPDCTDDEHTYERGKCALKPLRNGVVVDGDGKAPADPPYGG